MVVMRNKLANIEAKLLESLNNERRNDENDVIAKIKENSKFFYKFAKKFSTTNKNIAVLLEIKYQCNIKTISRTIKTVLIVFL